MQQQWIAVEQIDGRWNADGAIARRSRSASAEAAGIARLKYSTIRERICRYVNKPATVPFLHIRNRRIKYINHDLSLFSSLELSLIGVGQFGVAYECLNRLDGCIYAIKKSIKPVAGSVFEWVTDYFPFISIQIKDQHWWLMNETIYPLCFLQKNSVKRSLRTCGARQTWQCGAILFGLGGKPSHVNTEWILQRWQFANVAARALPVRMGIAHVVDAHRRRPQVHPFE